MSNSQLQLRVDPAVVYQYATNLDFNNSKRWCTRSMLTLTNACLLCPFSYKFKCLLDLSYNPQLELTKRILFERYPELAI